MAGVNFPRLVHAWKLGRLSEEPANYQIGRRLRWLSGDVWNLKCAFEMQGHPDIPSRLSATTTFLRDFLRPASTIDLIDSSDMRPAFAEFNKVVVHHGMRRVRSLFSAEHPAMAKEGKPT